MPFTLAHPAAVLPLKRFCPRHLSFGGLVVGSIVPDTAYLFENFKLDTFSHTFVGSLGYGLPVGLLMAWLFYGLRRKAVEWLPKTRQSLLMPMCLHPAPPLIFLAISILLGAWTHLLWDSFTHKNGWLVQQVPLLQIQVLQLGRHQLFLCQALGYASSFAGVAWLFLAYEKWLQTVDPETSPASFQKHLRNALFVGMLVLPIEAVHQLIHAPIGLALVAMCSIALMLGVFLGLANPAPAR